MLLLWLAALLLIVVVPPVILVTIGSAAARLADQAAVRRLGQDYPTEQMLALTYLEAPEQWPPAPIIEEP